MGSLTTTSSGSIALLNAWKAQSCHLRPAGKPSFRSYLPLRKRTWTFLVVQWLRICLPMQGTRVWSLVWEIFTCCRATKPVFCNYWAQAPSLCSVTRETTAMTSLHRATHRNERKPSQQWRPSTAKNINKQEIKRPGPKFQKYIWFVTLQ